MNVKKLVGASSVLVCSARSIFQCALDGVVRRRRVPHLLATIKRTAGPLEKIHLCQLHPSPLKNSASIEVRSVHVTPSSPAGHNKWSKIKRKKAVTDQQKSKLRGRILDQIRTAVAEGGGDPTTNIKLAGLLAQARSGGVPKSNIESALAGKGGSGVTREAVMYEGRGPSGYLLLVETLTENRNRTRPEIKHIIEKQGGILGDPGSSAFMFDQKAVLELSLTTNTDAMELAIEVGAEDVEVQHSSEGGELIQLKCEPNEVNTVCSAVREKGLEVSSTAVVYIAKSSVSLTLEQFQKAEKLVDLLNDQSDVVAVYSNHELA